MSNKCGQSGTIPMALKRTNKSIGLKTRKPVLHYLRRLRNNNKNEDIIIPLTPIDEMNVLVDEAGIMITYEDTAPIGVGD